MTTDTKQNPAGERVEEPAKRWRNWFHLDFGGESRNGTPYTAGLNCGEMTFPSKDVAETYFSSVNAVDQYWIARGISFVGAFPEGQRP